MIGLDPAEAIVQRTLTIELQSDSETICFQFNAAQDLAGTIMVLTRYDPFINF